MKRNNYSSKIKTKVAVEAIHGIKTVGEIASSYDIHPSIVSKWKRQALEYLPEAFSNKRVKQAKDESDLRDRLYQQIGRLQVELDWLKKKTDYID